MAINAQQLLQRTIKAGDGSDVTVEAKRSADGSVVISAQCGGCFHEHSISMGASDAPLPDGYDIVRAQADLDRACQFAADMAASKARRERLISELLSGIPGPAGP